MPAKRKNRSQNTTNAVIVFGVGVLTGVAATSVYDVWYPTKPKDAKTTKDDKASKKATADLIGGKTITTASASPGT